MISGAEVERLAEDWIAEFSVDPYVVKQREMTAWFKLDSLIDEHPLDALLVFEKIADKDPINWTFEGIAVGPLRTFLMIYENRYDEELQAIKRRTPSFSEMHSMAVEGL